jgi:hypothetical protein
MAQSFFALIGLLLILLRYAILINPYIWLLRTAAKIPTNRMHKSDCYNAVSIISAIASSKKEQIIANYLKSLEHSITELEREVLAQNKKAASAGQKYLERLRVERRDVYRKMLDVASLRKAAVNSSFQAELREQIGSSADCIDKLLAGAS